ncbi:MAG: AMP-binding protein [Archaeoglobus sp.]|nr:MAG: AMP-binding protein [Archaeoglobus sp.]
MNGDNVPYKKWETFGDIIKKIAEKYPENPAIITENCTMSYKELYEKAIKVAHGLYRLGIRKGDKVSLWMQNFPEWVVCWWAVPMLGATLVPVDHWYKTVEAEHIIGHSDSVAIITYETMGKWRFTDMINEVRDKTKLEHIIVAGENPEEDVEKVGGISFDELLKLGEGWEKDSGFIEEMRKVTPDDVSLILYTSGTTGVPKGVMLCQHQIIKNAYDQGENMRVTDRDRLLVPVPFTHCFGCVMSITLMANFGGAVVPLIVFNEEEALRKIEKHGCTMIHGTPTMFLRELRVLRDSKYDTSSLRTGIMAGAPCPEDLMTATLKEMSVNLCITYGLTEASPGITMTSLDDSIEDRVKTVGKPLPDIEVRIVDDNGKDVPRGQVGEIICRGYNVMKGYYKMPEKTAETIKDGWLYSGDLGIMDERGYIIFKGRKKELIIVGGFNVYPLDLEQYLRNFEKVQDVAIVGVHDEDLGEVVAAAVIPRDGVNLDPVEIVDYCYGKIASAKVPRYVYVTNSFPVSGRGKVQKFRLVKELEELIDAGRLKKIKPSSLNT